MPEWSRLTTLVSSSSAASSSSFMPEAAALLMPTDNTLDRLAQFKMAEDPLWDDPWDCPGCPPPSFDLPPPPRPPWLEDLDDCDAKDPLEVAIQQLETCDNLMILGTGHSYFESAFHSIAVVVVCALVAVILSLVLGVIVFRRRKSASHSTPTSSCSPASHGSATASNGGDVPGGQTLFRSESVQVEVPQQGHSKLFFSSSSSLAKPTSSSFRVKRLDTQTLPNHYIPDPEEKKEQRRRPLPAANMMSLRPVRDPEAIANEFRMRFPDPESRPPRMELVQQPPPQPASVYHNYPHIIIGGQPFYLIPSDPNSVYETDSYAYPAHNMPIYEEIEDRDDVASSVASDRGEAGSLPRMPPDSGAAVPRVLVNPLVRDFAMREKRQSLVNNNPSQQQRFVPISNNVCDSLKPRIAGNGGPAASAQPPTTTPSAAPMMMMATHVVASPAASNTSSSIYYYSDTLKPKTTSSSTTSTSSTTASARLSDDFSDSGFSHRSGSQLTKQPLSSGSSAESKRKFGGLTRLETVDTEVIVQSDGKATTLV